MSHTKEPWIICPGGRYDPEVIITTQARLDTAKGEICGMDVEFTGNHGVEQVANSRRIVACVNACAGISTDNLEINRPVKWLADQYNATIKQRDDLLAALQDMLQVMEQHEQLSGCDCSTGDAARAAIASVNGGAA